MKRTLAVLTLFASAFATAFAGAADFHYDLPAFSNVKVEDSFSVTIKDSKTYTVDIVADSLYREYLVCSVSAGELKIAFDEKSVPREVKTAVKVSGKSVPFTAVIGIPGCNLNRLELLDKTVLTESDAITSESLKIVLDDKADISKLPVETQFLILEAESMSKSVIQAKCDHIQVTMSGAAELKMDQSASTTEFNVAGRCKVEVKGLSNEMSLATKGNCKIVLSGTCPSVKYRLAGSSSVESLKLDCTTADVEMSSICSLTTTSSDKIIVKMSGGSTLNYAGDPRFVIEDVKSSSIHRYQQTEESDCSEEHKQ